VEAPLGIGKERVAPVDEHVAFFQERYDFTNHLVDRFTGLDHHHHLAWTFQRAEELLDCLGGHDVFSFTAGCGKFFGHGAGAVENADMKSF
jgi:hypothetical protein